METVLSHAIAACGTAGGTATQAASGSGGPGAMIPTFDFALATLAAGAGLLTLAAIVIAVVFTFGTRPRQQPPALVPVDAHVSPDGFYWWDGAMWRPRF